MAEALAFHRPIFNLIDAISAPLTVQSDPKLVARLQDRVEELQGEGAGNTRWPASKEVFPIAAQR